MAAGGFQLSCLPSPHQTSEEAKVNFLWDLDVPHLEKLVPSKDLTLFLMRNMMSCMIRCRMGKPALVKHGWLFKEGCTCWLHKTCSPRTFQVWDPVNPQDNDMNQLKFLIPGKTEAQAAEYFATYNGLLNSMEGHGQTMNFVMHRSQLKRNKKATKSLQPRKSWLRFSNTEV